MRWSRSGRGWSAVTGNPNTERPTPVTLRSCALADLALCGGDAVTVVASDRPGSARRAPARRGIADVLTTHGAIGPEFAHDELRRYAIARLLLAPGNFTAKLLEGGVPRWSLAAARLACQMVLAAPDTPANPLHGRFARVQKAFDELVDAGHGERWGDVPGEALLTLGDPDPVLRDAWPELAGRLRCRSATPRTTRGPAASRRTPASSGSTRWSRSSP